MSAVSEGPAAEGCWTVWLEGEWGEDSVERTETLVRLRRLEEVVGERMGNSSKERVGSGSGGSGGMRFLLSPVEEDDGGEAEARRKRGGSEAA
ncbi:hypothetical protein Bca4012_079272 [Brassica carinata]